MHRSTGHVASFPPFYSYKKDKDVKHEHYSGEIMFTKINLSESVANEHSEGRHL